MDAYLSIYNDERALNELCKGGKYPCHTFFCDFRHLYWHRETDEEYRERMQGDASGVKGATRLGFADTNIEKTSDDTKGKGLDPP